MAAPKIVTGALPANVEETRELLLAAVQSGRIEDLKPAISQSGKPDFGLAPGADPLAEWRTRSADGAGREILAVIGNLLANSPALLPIGPDAENNAVYVWPYLAEQPLDTLTPGQEVDLYRLVPHALARDMRQRKQWSWWRLAIAADGSWTVFRRFD